VAHYLNKNDKPLGYIATDDS